MAPVGPGFQTNRWEGEAPGVFVSYQVMACELVGKCRHVESGSSRELDRGCANEEPGVASIQGKWVEPCCTLVLP